MQMLVLAIQLMCEAIVMCVIPDYKIMFNKEDVDTNEALQPAHSTH